MLGDGKARLIIDLAAIAENYRYLQARAPKTALGAVVKADGYGLGALAVMQALVPLGCRSCFVNDVAAGLALRAQFADLEIFVLHGLAGEAVSAFADARLVPVLYQYDDVRRIAEALPSDAPPLPVGLSLDTGLVRLGFEAADLAAMLADRPAAARIAPALAMTQLQYFGHLEAPQNAVQRARFEQMRAALPPMRASLATSAGLFMPPDYHFDLARPGSALYGLAPAYGMSNPMRTVARLVAPVLQIRAAAPGTGVGYEGTFCTSRPARLAVFAAGYADGFLRQGSNRASVVIAGRLVPVVGRISMSLAVADITDLPEGSVKPGDAVELFGPALPPDAAAARMGTAGQELLCLAGALNQRVYVGA